MPIITVWYLPPNQKEDDFRRLHKSIVNAVTSIRELGLNDENDMTVLFPPDLMTYGVGTEIIVMISGLFVKPQRNEEVRQELAKTVGFVVKSLYPKAKVECLVQNFNPKEGFWSSEIEEKLAERRATIIGHMRCLNRKSVPPCSRWLVAMNRKQDAVFPAVIDPSDCNCPTCGVLGDLSEWGSLKEGMEEVRPGSPLIPTPDSRS